MGDVGGDVGKCFCGEVTVAKLPCGEVTGNRLQQIREFHYTVSIAVMKNV